MLEIEEIAGDSAYPVLVLSGRLVGNHIPKIKKICDHYLEMGKSVTIDLSDVNFIDPAGLRTLQELRCRGVDLVNCSFYISTEIDKFKC